MDLVFRKCLFYVIKQCVNVYLTYLIYIFEFYTQPDQTYTNYSKPRSYLLLNHTKYNHTKTQESNSVFNRKYTLTWIQNTSNANCYMVVGNRFTAFDTNKFTYVNERYITRTQNYKKGIRVVRRI